MQAARGTALTATDRSATSKRSSAAPTLALSVAAAAWVVDQATKVLAVRSLSDRTSVPLLGDFLQLTLVRNPGAAFSAGAAFTPVISTVALVATGVIVWYILKVRHPAWAVATGLLLAGVAGNLTDRLFRSPGPMRGHVVDFFQLPHWPVFNVADICIDVAAVLFVVLLLRGIRFDAGSTGEDGGDDRDQR